MNFNLCRWRQADPKFAGKRVRASQKGFSQRSPEQLFETLVAIWLIVQFFERTLVQRLETKYANEMLGMELAVHCGDAPTDDRLLAGRAERTALRVKVLLTVRQAIVIEEASGIKRRIAFSADETLRMPLTLESGIVVAQNGITTATALWSKHAEVVISAER